MPTATAPIRLLVLVAHPDDAEFHCGGLMTVYRELGNEVKIITVTNGEAGHHEMSGPSLTARRRGEAAAAARVIGATSEVWDFPDGKLQPTLEVRERIIREIRGFAPISSSRIAITTTTPTIAPSATPCVTPPIW